ncbi:hypothetical protein [Paenilisteria newyorkensis]|uniref:hypothetical protein n=1 Tax=Listeria newyorkensis TaxID=1497681 RepID=UPI0007410E0F|nr:hypothetical protein [Listeria newyorkensis]
MVFSNNENGGSIELPHGFLKQEFDSNKNLLHIELKDNGSIPTVTYKGIEIKHRAIVEFHFKWETKGHELNPCRMRYKIVFYDGEGRDMKEVTATEDGLTISPIHTRCIDWTDW